MDSKPMKNVALLIPICFNAVSIIIPDYQTKYIYLYTVYVVECVQYFEQI